MKFAATSRWGSSRRNAILGFAALVFCALGLACQSPADGTSESGLSRSEAAVLKKRVRALEKQTRQLQNRVSVLSLQPRSWPPTKVAANLIQRPSPSTPQSAWTPVEAKPGPADPAARIGKTRWNQIAEFRDERELTPEHTKALVDLVQREKGAVWAILRSETLTESARVSQTDAVRKRTDDAVAAQLGNENGAHWRALRKSRWGNRK
jgi:hypothetical protein